ncbi:hypothetical protein AX15_001502 [Amanita polypyramis BW_CC]|nr:hypothetical protein AX15_001502 [Amanita polypyramis BW_CC]
MSRIILYDVASKISNYAWSPNTWKTRLTLNYKRIPFTTEWVEFPDIEAKCKELNIPPSIIKRDGSSLYTVPAIWDPSTKTGISNSPHIAKYLDETYPDTPPVLFDGIEEYNHIMTAYKLPELRNIDQFLVPLIHDKLLSPRSQEYFGRTREQMFGRKIGEIMPTGEERVKRWDEVRKGFDIVDGWLQKNGGPFARGEEASFVDFALGGHLMWYKRVFGEESEYWKDILTWNEGRWGKYADNLEKLCDP